jgi:hypothetical protein
VKVADVQDFLNRDWSLLQQLKADCWIQQKRAITPAAALDLGAELRDYARSVRSDWPSLAERDEDLAAHVRLAGILQRVKQSAR